MVRTGLTKVGSTPYGGRAENPCAATTFRLTPKPLGRNDNGGVPENPYLPTVSKAVKATIDLVAMLAWPIRSHEAFDKTVGTLSVFVAIFADKH